ncbi:hypothetical protein FPOAC2_13117 [Fusarium poae]
MVVVVVSIRMSIRAMDGILATQETYTTSLAATEKGRARPIENNKSVQNGSLINNPRQTSSPHNICRHDRLETTTRSRKPQGGHRLTVIAHKPGDDIRKAQGRWQRLKQAAPSVHVLQQTCLSQSAAT